LQCHVVGFKIDVFDFFHIQGLHIFASILSDFHCLARAAWRTFFHSVYSDSHIHFIYSMFLISLLSLVFISFRVIVIQLTYGYSKSAIEFDWLGYSWISENGQSSSEFAIGRAWSIRINGITSGQSKCSPQNLPGPRIQCLPPFSASGKGLEQCQKEIPGF
jgi:hypothetical protein